MRIENLISSGAIFYVSHSGGKDSQAMYGYVRAMVPDDQIVVVHANLGEVDHGVLHHIRLNTEHDVNVVTAVWADGSEKTLLGIVEKRFRDRPTAPSWPSPRQRYCTSDLKRAPVQKFIRNDLKQKGLDLAVNCTGLRAEESGGRAKKKVLEINKALTTQSRTVYDWLPIHKWTTAEVFGYINQMGQEPFWM